MVTVPFQSGSGGNRTRSMSRSSRALLVATGPMSDQPVPPSVEYCQVPLVLSMAVIAIPSRAPGLASVMRLPPAEVMMAAIVSPRLEEQTS